MTTTTLKQIDKNIRQVATNGDKLNKLIHETAMMILRHAAPKEAGGEGHGDCSRAQHLVMAMPASMRRTSLIAWFSKYSPIVTKNDDKWDAKMHKPETAAGLVNPLYRPFDLKGADKEPFYEIANKNPEREPVSFEDLVRMVERLNKRIEKQIDENMVKDEDVAKAKAIVRAISGLHLDKITGVNENSQHQSANTTASNEDEASAPVSQVA